jgi:hypothetical protein
VEDCLGGKGSALTLSLCLCQRLANVSLGVAGLHVLVHCAVMLESLLRADANNSFRVLEIALAVLS